jgi:hypothetical protein
MRLASRHGPLYLVELERLPLEAGVYVFARQWGKGFEALYIGKANVIRSRVKGQLNNLRLMQHLRNAKSGSRVIIAGALVTRPGQTADRCLPILERTLMRHFLSEGHDLVNVQGTLLRQHEVESTRRPKYFIPKVMYLDKSRD